MKEQEDLSCTILTEFAELEACSADWTNIQAESGQGEIFQHFAWIQAWWESFGKDYQLCAPVVRRGERIVAILPLARKGRRLFFLAHTVSDYNHFLAESAVASVALPLCLDAVLAQKGDWDEIMLENVPEFSLLHECLRRLPVRWRRSMSETSAGPCPTLVLEENKQDALTSILSKGRLKQTVRRLQRIGKLHFRHIEDRQEAISHLDEFILQHIRRSSLAGRRSNFLAGEYVAFYRSLLERLDPRVEIRFSILTLDDRPVAYHFGTLFGSKYLFYKPVFDVNLWEFSPGQVLLWYLFDYLRTAEAREFDFGLGDEPYKLRFSNRVRQNLRFSLLAPGYRSLPYHATRVVLASAKNRMRKHETLYRSAKALSEQWQKLRLSCRQNGFATAVVGRIAHWIFHKEISWLLGVGPFAEPVADFPGTPIAKLTLGDLADLSLEFPEVLTEEKLLEARRRLRLEETAWLAQFEGSGRIILWTALGTELSTPCKDAIIPKMAMFISEFWPLGPPGIKTELLLVLRRVASIANDMNLPVWAICPGRLFAAKSVLNNEGFRIVCRWQCLRIFGKIFTKTPGSCQRHGATS